MSEEANLVPNNGEGEPRPTGFGVYVEDPYQIYQSTRDDLLLQGNYKNISEWVKDPNQGDVDYTVSETNFGDASPMFASEKTDLKIQAHYGPLCEINSSLNFNKRAEDDQALYHYDDPRLKQLERILKDKGFDAGVYGYPEEVRRAMGIPKQGQILIKNGNKLYMQVDFGPTTPEDALALKEKHKGRYSNRVSRLEKLSAPEVVIDNERSLLRDWEEKDMNSSISVGLRAFTKDRGGEGIRMISFRDHETFIRNLHFYSVAYQGLIEALHEERSLPLPQTPIIISKPKV